MKILILLLISQIISGCAIGLDFTNYQTYEQKTDRIRIDSVNVTKKQTIKAKRYIKNNTKKQIINGKY